MNGGLPERDKLERQKAAVIRFLYWFMIIGGGFFAVKYLLPVFVPFILAYLIAWMLDRPTSWLTRRAHMPRGLAAGLLILLFATVATGVLVLLGAMIFLLVRGGVRLMPDLFSQVILPALEFFFQGLEDLAGTIAPVLGETLTSSMDRVLQLLSEGVMQLSGSVLSSLGGLITGVPSVLMKTLITLIAAVFIAADFSMIQGLLRRCLPDRARSILRECGSFFGHTVPKFLASYSLIFLITFTELTAGFFVLGVGNAAAVAIVVALLDILPVLGTGGVLIPWGIICLFRGDLFMGIGMLVLYLIITVIRQMLEPRLVGKQIHLHPVLTFAGMLAGLRFFGFLGLFGVPLLLAFIRHLHEQGVIRIPLLETEEAEEKQA